MLHHLELQAMRGLVVVIGTLMSLLTLTAQHPGAAFFSLQCQPNAIMFSYNNTPVLQATVDQIAPPLLVARQTGQNQRILAGDVLSVWALSSDELQIHFDSDPDGTKWIVASSICGTIAQPQTAPNQTVAIAIAAGEGSASAFAYAGGGNAVAQAQASGQASALAYAVTYTSTATKPQPTHCTHTVHKGENLFQIARRYGISVHALGEQNNLRDISLLLVGQQLVVPCGGHNQPAAPPSTAPANAPTSTVPQVPVAAGFGSTCSSQAVHIMAPGDNLFRLAQRYGTTVAAIQTANQIADPTQILIGTPLRIPCVG